MPTVSPTLDQYFEIHKQSLETSPPVDDDRAAFKPNIHRPKDDHIVVSDEGANQELFSYEKVESSRTLTNRGAASS